MLPNQKSYGSNGYQNSLFPMTHINISQGEGGSFSHEGRYALDLLGWDDTGRKYQNPYYAPFDCRCISINTTSAYVVWESINMVNTPTGLRKQTVVFIHDDYTHTFTVGETRLQGQVIGRTGTSGNVTGDHLHLQVFKHGQQWVYPDGMLHTYDSFFIDNTVLVNHSSYPYNWRVTQDEDGGGGTDPDPPDPKPPTESGNVSDLIKLLLSDCLNGWKNFKWKGEKYVGNIY